MKAAEFSSTLSTLSITLNELGARSVGAGVQELAALLARHPQTKVAQLAKSVVHRPNGSSSATRVTTQEVANALVSLQRFLVPLVKKDVASDLAELVHMLRRLGDVPLAELASEQVASASKRRTRKGAAPVDQVLIDGYLKRLQGALGDDESFMDLYRELSDDKRVTKEAAVLIADRFMGPVAPSTSRPKALQRILSRHRKLVGFEAGSVSIGA